MIEKKIIDKYECKDIYAITLSNDSKISVRILTYGGIIQNFWVKDTSGNVKDIVMGFDTLSDYIKASGYQGAIIGRTCNRIKKGKFTLDGNNYSTFINDGKNDCHGGEFGFNKKIWNFSIIDNPNEPSLVLSYLSKDMEENYPGNLIINVTYKLLSCGGLSINYRAMTDKKTIINMTNHSYFNLDGFDSGNILKHKLWINSDKINEQDFELIPTGNIIDVSGTPYDFTSEKEIGKDFNSDDDMKKQQGGYDNNFIFNHYDGKISLGCICKNTNEDTTMQVFTDQPCVQIYTSNMINEDDIPFKNGVKQKKNCAICFETQHMPDAINHPGFTDITLNPGETYDYTTIFLLK